MPVMNINDLIQVAMEDAEEDLQTTLWAAYGKGLTDPPGEVLEAIRTEATRRDPSDALRLALAVYDQDNP